MKPDQKYMPAFRKSSDGDIKFEQFNPTYPLNISSITLMPILSFNNASMNNMRSQSGVSGESNNTNSNFPNDSSNTLYSYNKPSKKESDKNIENETLNSNQDEYRGIFNNNRLIPNELLKDFDLDLDEDVDLVRNCCNSDIGKIYNYIQNNNPGIITLMESYCIPKPMIGLIIRRIIKLTLDYSNKK